MTSATYFFLYPKRASPPKKPCREVKKNAVRYAKLTEYINTPISYSNLYTFYQNSYLIKYIINFIWK